MHRPPQRSEGVVQSFRELRVSAELGLLIRSIPPEDGVRQDAKDGPVSYGRGIPADAENPSKPSADDWSVQEPEQTVLMQQEEEGTEGPVVLIVHAYLPNTTNARFDGCAVPQTIFRYRNALISGSCTMMPPVLEATPQAIFVVPLEMGS